MVKQMRIAPENCREDIPSVASPADEELALAACQDRSQFSGLYRRYADPLYRYALGRTRSPDVAADIVGDTMVAVLESIAKFDPQKGSFAAWLFTIANRKIADRGRRHHRWLRFLSSRPSSQPLAEHDDVLDTVMRQIDAERLYATLDELPDLNRRIVLLSYGAGLTSTQIGEITGLSPGAVRTRLTRALDSLAKKLGDDSE